MGLYTATSGVKYDASRWALFLLFTRICRGCLIFPFKIHAMYDVLAVLCRLQSPCAVIVYCKMLGDISVGKFHSLLEGDSQRLCFSSRVIDGLETLDELEKLPVNEKTYRPLNDVRIKDITIHANPFAL